MSESLRDFLKQGFDKRRRKNAMYSLRGFARDLAIDSTALSRILAGTRPIGVKAAQRLVAALKLSPATRATEHPATRSVVVFFSFFRWVV